ncbi:MAG: DinB family protein [Cyanobacteriota bacterium]|nr:DinB family protein [Cyanobacteriota bacterium]
MHLSQNFQLMARYNQWMNEKLYRVCARIPNADRKKDLGAFFKSIHGTLDHILYGDKAWMGRFIEEPFSVTTIGQQLYPDFTELRAEREATDRQILEWTQTLDPQWLESPFEYTSNVDGKTRILPTWALVTHMFNHQTHHRGQVTTLVKQLGIDPGITDLPWLPEFENP